MEIVLYQPQIPQNTGNVVRTCAVTGSSLCLVGPLGFSTSSRMLKRAGLDYWEGVQVREVDCLKTLLEASQKPFYFFSSHGDLSHTDVHYSPDHLLVFGSETTGLPGWVHEQWPERCVRIPMKPGKRCLNLASSVAIGLYEAWRQNNHLFISD